MKRLKINTFATAMASAAALTVSLLANQAYAQESVRIGLATQAWWPTVVAETAVRQGMFEKEGLAAELTVYQSGAEAFTALAADAADIISIQPSIVSTGRARGINAKMIAEGSAANYGWHMIVPVESDIKDVKELEGENVGITSAGSLSDFLAQWTTKNSNVSFNAIPLGGSGLVPNLISENVKAAVIFSPLSFQVMQDGQGRSLIDYGAAIPAHLNSGWAASDASIDANGEVLQKALNAIYGGVKYLQSNEKEAVALLMELNQISEEVAQQEYNEQFKKLSADGVMTLEGAQSATDLAKIGGMTDLAPADELFDARFTPVTPTE